VNIPRYYALWRDGVPTTGHVIGLEPAIHQRVRYFYNTSDGTFYGSDTGGAGDFKLLRLEADVRVVYLPDHPGVSLLGNPAERFANEILSVGLAVVIVPTFVVTTTLRRQARRARQG
jgi:hypothetical protein